MGNSVLDTCSSGEELTIKTRKPYTITKQRERWTEDEHNRFLEALKKHGRAWQRIEEHIGTKTAVQIRSHAQKFFSKLEREALNKGMSATKVHDIDVPPPRPKRKPSNPYPRKTVMVASISPEADSKNRSVSSTQCSNLVLSLENGLTSQPSGVFYQERSTQRKEKEILSEGDDSPQVLTLFEEAPCASISSASKAPPNPGAFREFMPTKKETSDETQMDEVSAIAKSKEKLKLERLDADCTDLEIGIPQGSKLDNHFLNPHAEAPPLEIKNDLNPVLASKEMQVESTHGYPRHVPVLVLDGDDMETSTPILSLDLADSSPMVPQLGIHGSPSTFKNQTISATSELHNYSTGSAPCPPFSIFHPHVTHFHGNADTQKLSNPACALNVSSALSSLIISNLLQNPAAHAAASLAASCWTCTDIENLIDGGPFRYMNPSPSIAAVAAATVAAATAWWATHGLLPICPPHPTNFAFAPTPSPTTIPITETFPFPLSKNTEERKQEQPLCPELCATPEAQREVSASSRLSSSGSEESSETDPDGTKLETGGARQENILTGASSDQAKPIKQVDRSSCGSNTPSSSEIETDVVLENQEEEGKEESKAAELDHLDSELSNRRCRSAGNINDSWKEVSEEGRMAFRALFSRHVLPQSFSSPQALRNKLQPNSSMEQGNQNLMKNDEDRLTLHLDLNDTTSLLLRSNADKGFAVACLGHAKSKDRPTGFEPYKRCSAQSSPESDEKGAKRIRLQGKAAI